MATYSTTFSGQTTGANPTNCTDRYTAETDVSVENPALGEQDDRVLELGSADSGWIFQSFDDVDGDANRDNSEVLIKYRNTADWTSMAEAALRASGSASSETCYIAYISSSNLTIARSDSGTVTSLATVDTNGAVSPLTVSSGLSSFIYEEENEWHWVRFRANGTGATVSLKAKWWVDGYKEPDNWTVEYDDTSASRITAAGWTGVSKRGFNGDTYVDFIGVGTNGDTAPSPSADTQAHRVTGSYAQAIVGGGGETARVTGSYAQAIVGGGGEVARVTGVYAQVIFKAAPAASTSQSIQCIIMT
jgi:hypothetical protein